MSTETCIGYMSGALALVSTAPYVLSILAGNTRPSRTAYAIWSVAEVVAASSYIAAGARTTIWFVLSGALSAVIIFALSLKRGIGGRSRLDTTCLGLSAAVIAVWVVTGDADIAVYAGISTTVLGYIVIIKKARIAPETENFTSWAMCFGAAVLNLAALVNLHPHIVVRPVVSAAGAGAVVWFVGRARWVRCGSGVRCAWRFTGLISQCCKLERSVMAILAVESAPGELTCSGPTLRSSAHRRRGSSKPPSQLLQVPQSSSARQVPTRS